MAVDLSLSGLASGFDWKSLVSQLADAERIPQTQLRAQQTTLNRRNSALGSMKTLLTTLQTRIAALKDTSIYDSRAAQTSDSSIATASVSANAALGSFAFNVTQMASAARFNGTGNIGKLLSDDSDVSDVTLADAGFATAVTAGKFTVNGKQVDIVTTDTLQDVFDKIAAATNNEVSASYDFNTDKITLTHATPGTEIILGSATDTSNFLQVTRLTNNGTDSITSSAMLGGVRLTATLAQSNLTTAITDDGNGAGEFKINGVSITYNTSTDTVRDVLSRINNSTAGVTATYDSLNDRFVLANKTTGDIGVAMEDVTGNFLAATGLADSTIVRGKNLIYTVNDSDPLISQSNVITETSSGISGLSLTALKEGSVTVTVNSDTSKIKTAIQSFIEAYNSVQSFIDTQTASSTDAKGVVTAGLLANDSDASAVSASLRKTVYSTITGLPAALDHLADLGIATNGNDNKLSLPDGAVLDNALSGNLNGVRNLFASSTTGIAVALDAYLTKTIGEDGTLIAHQDALTKQSGNIDTQIADLEKIVQSNADRLTTQFVAMERAQAKINQQLTYLLQQFA